MVPKCKQLRYLGSFRENGMIDEDMLLMELKSNVTWV